ncbi:MAG: helix-turn-helix domain-containing protein [Maledivibacter sp.]|nr:helix-turn-helix domain-containing protein [Maledivibacter sp.]
MDYVALGNRIREERLRLGLTQEKLAEDIDISISYMGQIERGERSLTLGSLVKVVNRLGVTIDYLLTDSVKVEDEQLMKQLLMLMDGRTSKEKEMALNLVKLVFGYLDE